MQVQVNKTVKATTGKDKKGNPIRTTWQKGKVFDDDAVNQIPEAILRMVKEGSPLVSVVGAGAPVKDDLTTELLQQARQTIIELEARVAELEAKISELEGGETFVCPVCSKPFPSQRGLNGHMTKMHPAVPSPS